MINPDGTDIQVLHLYTSFMLCLPPAWSDGLKTD
jgi:hypothetical protein